MRTLLEGKLGSVEGSEGGMDLGLGVGGSVLSGRESFDLDGRPREVSWAKDDREQFGLDGEMADAVPVPLALCVGAALMRLITSVVDDKKIDRRCVALKVLCFAKG